MASDTATQAVIRRWLKARPEQGQRHVHRVASGLDLTVYASGPAAWFWRGRPRGVRLDGARWPMQRIKLGNTDTMTLAAAIVSAAALKAAIASGGDPAADRRQAIAARLAARKAAASAGVRSGSGPEDQQRDQGNRDRAYRARDYQVTSMRLRRDVLVRVKLLAQIEQTSMHWIIETALVAYLASRGAA